MRSWTPERVAEAAGASLARTPQEGGGPLRAVIDSRAVAPGDLFVGFPGESVDGGAFARDALAAGAWGVLVLPGRASQLAQDGSSGAVLGAPDLTAALGGLGRAWRAHLGCDVLAVTGSTGKTSTKDILAALLSTQRRTHASAQNFNTEIGLPLAILEADEGTEALVLELGMRGAGEIAELVAICEPNVGIITNIAPVHLELLGSLEAIAATKAELIAGMATGATAVLPAGEPLLAEHLRADLRTLTFDAGLAGAPLADVRLESVEGERVTILADGRQVEIETPLVQAHNLRNALAATAAAVAIGVTPSGRVDVALSQLRGQRIALPRDVVLVNDCYNANPLSMRAALDDLAATAPGRRVAVLGDMLELGDEARGYHVEIGRHAGASGVDLLVTVGELAAHMGPAFDGPAYPVPDAAEAATVLAELLEPGDTVLVKGSRGVGLEVVAEALAVSDDSDGVRGG